MPRMERVEPRPDKAFPYTLASAVDSDGEEGPGVSHDTFHHTFLIGRPEQYDSEPAFKTAATSRPAVDVGNQVLLYDGEEDLVLEPDDGAWIPVMRGGPPVSSQGVEAVVPCVSHFDVVPGLWEPKETEGSVLVTNLSCLDVIIQKGDTVCGLRRASVQTRLCAICGQKDTDAWEIEEGDGSCKVCGAPEAGGPAACKACGGPAVVLAHEGCSSCVPAEETEDGELTVLLPSSFHIQEEPGMMGYLTDVLSPPDEYYEELRKDLGKRHPSANPHVLDHLVS